MNETETTKPPSWKPLDPLLRRVLGVLVEKAKTTPAGYPMTVNAITTGCNQKSNRDPVMDLEPFDVEKALDQLRELGAVSEVDWMGRSAKYRHHAYDWLGVSKAEMAVMAELLLRGAQTLGDLRGRAARMEPIADVAELKPIVEGLIQRGLMIELTPPGRGQIVSHHLYLGPEMAELEARYGGQAERPRMSAGSPAPASRTSAPPDAIAELSAAIDTLRGEVATLKEQVADLTRRLELRG